MDLKLSHQKDLAEDWNISASATAGAGEKIASAQIVVNGSTEFDQSFDPPLSSWQKELKQKGVYPGDNTVRLAITDDKGAETDAEDSWS
jgi:hypothetical protein